MKDIHQIKVLIVDHDRAAVAECEGAFGAEIDVLISDCVEDALHKLKTNDDIVAIVTIDNEFDLKTIRDEGFTQTHICGPAGIAEWRQMFEEARMQSY